MIEFCIVCKYITNEKAIYHTKNIFYVRNVVKLFLKRKVVSVIFLVLSVIYLAFFVGCGASLKPGAPIVRKFEFIKQDELNPRIFFFRVEWEDAEGDLATTTKNGKLVLDIEDLDKGKSVQVAFSIPETALSKKGANIGVFSSLAVELRAENGQYPKQIKVVLTLFDSAGFRSNRPWLVIESTK